MCTHNGARFLHEQLSSLEHQSYSDWRLVVSDDVSSDQTLDVLSNFKSRMGPERVHVITGQVHKGFARNYRDLAAEPTISGEFFAFCDQDDVWETDKLSRAVEWLKDVSPSVPALYCSRTKHIDAAGRPIGASRLFKGVPAFTNALVQSIAGGNTMVFNDAARQLMARCKGMDAPAHDWLLYILVTACDGAVKYDANPTVRYRLHEDNAIGHPDWYSRLQNIRNQNLHNWTKQHLAILQSIRPCMSLQNRAVLDEFCKISSSRVLERLSALRSGIHRSSTLGNIALITSAALGRF
jgi:glycosyltransferase involved in cell wall biosynthesis